MKLYVVNGSPNSRKVRAVVNHLGLVVEEIFLDLFRGDLKQDAYLKMNPNGMVPTLVDGDFVLWESNAINKYLCAQCSGNSLYPDDIRLQADIDRWLSWELAHFNQQLGSVCFETFVKPMMGLTTDKVLLEASMQRLSRSAPILERHLNNRLYMVGDDITLADYAIVHIESLKDMTAFDWAPYPNINAYFDRMREVPYLAKTSAKPEELGRIPVGAVDFITTL